MLIRHNLRGGQFDLLLVFSRSCIPSSILLYLQYERLLTDSQGIKKSEFVLFTEVLHLHASHISHFKVTSHNAVQQPLRWTAQHRGDQTLEKAFWFKFSNVMYVSSTVHLELYGRQNGLLWGEITAVILKWNINIKVPKVEETPLKHNLFKVWLQRMNYTC